MEISQQVMDGLMIAGDPDVITNLVYSHILNDVFTVFHNLKVSKSQDFDSKAKLAHAALLTLLLEAAKHDCDLSLVGSFLEECKMESSRANQFLKYYQEHKLTIQDELAKIGKTATRIVDVTWRQDYVIKTNYCEKIGQANYLLSLKTLNSQCNALEDITFGCTIDQLQDLVFKLKDAAKCIERSAVH